MKPMSSKYKERKQYQSLGGMRSLIYKQVKQQVANKTKRNPKFSGTGTVIGNRPTDRKLWKTLTLLRYWYSLLKVIMTFQSQFTSLKNHVSYSLYRLWQAISYTVVDLKIRKAK